MFKKLATSLAFLLSLSFVTPAFAADALPSGAVPALVFNGGAYEIARTANVFKPQSAVVITSETTIWTPAAGKKFRVMGWCLTQGVATGNVTLKDNTAGTTILIIPANTIAVSSCVNLPGNGYLSTTAANVLTATGASTETISGTVFGTEE